MSVYRSISDILLQTYYVRIIICVPRELLIVCDFVNVYMCRNVYLRVRMGVDGVEELRAVDELMRELQEEWGQVYVRYMGDEYFDGKECTVSNVTDEGLPVGCESKRVTGSTLSEALRKAHDEYVSDES